MATNGNNIYPEQNEEEVMDIKNILLKCLVYWPWFVISIILCLITAFIYLRFQTPIYSTTTTVLIKQGDKNKNNTASSTFTAMQDLGMLSMASNFDNEIELIQARTLIQKVVNRLDLNITYTQDSFLAYDRELYKNTPLSVWMAPEEAEKLNGPLTIKMTFTPEKKLEAIAQYTVYGKEEELSKTFENLPAVFITPVGTLTFTQTDSTFVPQSPYIFTATIISPTIAALQCKQKLSASALSKSTTIIKLSYNDSQKQRSIDFLNTLVTLYNQDTNDDKNEVASRTAEFIDSRIQIINQELGTTESELAAYKQKAGLTDLNTDAQLALQGSSEYQQRQAENNTQLRLIGFLRSYIENEENMYEVIPANIGLNDAGLSTLIARYNELLIERKRLLRTSSESNPAVINLNSSIEATRRNVITSVNSAQKGLEITRSNLEHEAKRYENRINAAPQQEKELLSISRQQEIKANLYLLLLQKREENAITLAATANNGRMIEAPLCKGQIAPVTMQIYLIALFIGLCIPLGLLYIIHLLRFKIENQEDVERITNVPVIGNIPKVSGKTGIVIQENRNELMEEIFRSIRTNLQYMLKDNQKVIMVTSTTSGEGKSFTAGNLAASFAMLGKRVVIVGLDIRKPGLNKVFKISAKLPGITSYLAHPNDINLLDLCQNSHVSENLKVLPGGIVPPNPTELLTRSTLDDAINILKENFDYVILDTAPIGMVTDTQLIGRVADVTIYICRANYTLKTNYRLINELYNKHKLPNLCTLINSIDMNKRKNGLYYGYGKYGHYGKYGNGRSYGYGYGYGQRTNDK